MNAINWSGGTGKSGSSSASGAQPVLTLALFGWAGLTALILIRSLFLTIGVQDTLWVAATVFRITDLFVLPLTWIPGSDLQIIGKLTLADLALLAIVAVVPFAILAFGRNQRH